MFKKILLFLALLAAGLAFPRSALGFGITPAEINADNLKPGSHYEREVYVVRPADEVGEKLNVVLETDLGEMDSWFKFVPGKEFEFPTGKNVTSFKAVVDVPADAALKDYKGQVTAKGMSEKKANEGVTIIKGAVLGVAITTTKTSQSNLKVLSVKAPDVNSGDPIRLIINIENLGNTAQAPDQVNLEVMDLFEKPIESLSDNSLEKIEPFTTKEIQAEFNSNLEKGQYRVNALVLFQNKQIAQEKMVLTVNAKPASITENIVRPSFVPAGWDRETGMALVAFGLLLFVIIVILLFRKKRAKDPDFEKKLAKLAKENKLLSWTLIAVSIILICGGLLLVLYDNKSEGKQEEVTREEVQVSPTQTEIPIDTPTPVKSVKGVSAESEEPVKPLVVKRPGTPGKYPVYDNPGFDSEIIYEAKDGETFEVVSEKDGWFNVILENGTSGWLHETSIKNKN